MISRVKGELLSITSEIVEVMTPGGVAYDIAVPAMVTAKLPETGGEVMLFTYLVVREDAHLLYGFSSPVEREVFIRLISIQGVGPRLGLTLLSSLKIEELAKAVKNKNIAVLTAISGVGKKTAERLMVELSGKLDDIAVSEAVSSGSYTEAVKALMALGVGSSDAERAVRQVMGDLPENTSTPALVKAALGVIKG